MYLDIDDLYVYGKYSRVIAVLYLPINATYLLNINLYLVRKGYARVLDYSNEFNPHTWRLIVVNPCIIKEMGVKPSMPPSMMLSSLNINLSKVTELRLGEYAELRYIQPYVKNDEVRILAVYRLNERVLLKLYGVNGTDGRVKLLAMKSVPKLGYVYISSYDKSKIVMVPTLCKECKNLTVIDLGKARIYILKIPLDIKKDTTYYLHSRFMYDDLVAFESRKPNELIIVNVSSRKVLIYRLNLSRKVMVDPLVVTPNVALVVSRPVSSWYDKRGIIYDLARNVTLMSYDIEDYILKYVNQNYAVIFCKDIIESYRKYRVIDFRRKGVIATITSFRISYDPTDRFILVNLHDSLFLVGFVKHRFVERPILTIIVVNLSNGSVWYEGIDLRDHYLGSSFKMMSSFGGYVVMLFGHKLKRDRDYSILTEVAVLAVSPISKRIAMSYIRPKEDNIIYSYSCVVNNYVILPVVKNGEVYLEIFKLNIIELPMTTYSMNISYINTVKTITTKVTVTEYKYRTIYKTYYLTKTYTSTISTRTTCTRVRVVPTTTTKYVSRLITTKAVLTKTVLVTKTITTNLEEATIPRGESLQVQLISICIGLVIGPALTALLMLIRKR